MDQIRIWNAKIERQKKEFRDAQLKESERRKQEELRKREERLKQEEERCKQEKERQIELEKRNDIIRQATGGVVSEDFQFPKGDYHCVDRSYTSDLSVLVDRNNTLAKLVNQLTKRVQRLEGQECRRIQMIEEQIKKQSSLSQ